MQHPLMQWAPGVAPLDATLEALLYAMRINALTYEQLFDAMAVYIACTYGSTAYDDFNAVACNHGIRDCTEPMPISCESCGNGAREGGETCDGTDWQLTACDDLPEFSGGTLTCDQTSCALDFTQCTMAGVDTTAGDAALGEASTTGAMDTDPGAAGVDPGGCGCREPRSDDGEGGLLVLSLSLLGTTRRRRCA